MIFRKYIFVIGILIATQSFSQVNYEAKVMSWNVLNWPSNSNLVADTTQRCPAYRTIINYALPDILITCENTSISSSPYFLNQVMNTGPNHYAAGTFINGYDTDNAIYYRDDLFDFVSNQAVHTALRDISHFTLVYKQTNDTIHLFSCHLKAAQGYEIQRGIEIEKLRAVTNAFPPGTNFLIGGDFNLYNDTEPAYINLLQDNPNDDGNFLDVLHLTGLWNSFSYAPYHTQSTHLNSTPTFSSGGLDDRFDMILFSNGVSQPTGVYYVPGSYINIGNDGHHYNKDINYGTNTSVPLDVANALFNASDHLPIMLTLAFGPAAGIEEAGNVFSGVNVFPDPITADSKVRFVLKEKCKVQFIISDILGHRIDESEISAYEPGEYFHSIDGDKLKNSGFYFISIKFDNTLVSKKIIVIN